MSVDDVDGDAQEPLEHRVRRLEREVAELSGRLKDAADIAGQLEAINQTLRKQPGARTVSVRELGTLRSDLVKKLEPLKYLEPVRGEKDVDAMAVANLQNIEEGLKRIDWE